MKAARKAGARYGTIFNMPGIGIMFDTPVSRLVRLGGKSIFIPAQNGVWFRYMKRDRQNPKKKGESYLLVFPGS